MSEPYVDNIASKTLANSNFRTVLYTAKHTQLVVMSLLPNENIGMEVHNDVDQFIRVELGQGIAILNGKEYVLGSGSSVVIPAGTNHDIINTSPKQQMKLYTLYSPPEHPVGTIHKTKIGATEH